MIPSHVTLSAAAVGTPRAVASEQLPLLQTPSSRNGDATLIDIANQHEQLLEPEPVIGREFWTMLSLVYPVVRCPSMLLLYVILCGWMLIVCMCLCIDAGGDVGARVPA